MTLLSGQPRVIGSSAASGSWAALGDLPVARQFPGAGEGPVLLADGRVLLAGGSDSRSASLADAAVFDPATGSWTPVAPLSVTRRLHTMTCLADGRVLAAGGAEGALRIPVVGLASAELFDPATGRWTPTGSLREARSGHSATLLADGRVLVAGGEAVRSAQTNGTLRSAEVYDPKTGQWAATGAMTDARWGHDAVRLADGRVLAVGGILDGNSTGLAFCELYDPASGTWTPTGSMARPRWAHQVTRLADGGVLVTGGLSLTMVENWVLNPHSHATAERYDPATGEWSPAAAMPAARSFHRAVLLSSGRVLILGGTDSATLNAGYRSAALYDPATEAWTAAGGLVVGRWGFGATALADGRVLATAGVTRSNYARPGSTQVLTTSTEIFTP